MSFLKMGLYSQGYIGKRGSVLVSDLKRIKRRHIVDGFPIETPFHSLEEVKHYLSGDKIICLLCGKAYRSISNGHLEKIHNITPDQYREKYKIPYTYGLICKTTKDLFVQKGKKMAADNDNLMNDLDYIRTLRKHKYRENFHRKQYAKNNFKVQHIVGRRCPWKLKHEMIVNPETGELETISDRKKRLTAKLYSPQYYEKMKKPKNVQGKGCPNRFQKRNGGAWFCQYSKSRCIKCFINK
jgi:hypothetical protein